MKEYYYSAKESDIKILKVEDMPDKKVYMTLNKNFALMKMANTYINLFITNEKNEILFLNLYSDLFRKIYKDMTGYIYSAALPENIFSLDVKNEKIPYLNYYYTLNDVKLTSVKKVNIYEEFMQLYKVGIFKIIEKKDIPEDYINDLKRYYKNRYEHNFMSKGEIDFFNKYLPSFID